MLCFQGMNTAAAVQVPAPQAPHCFYPEMGEKPAEGRLFYSHHCYSFCWAESRKGEAEALFRKLKIRPSMVRLVDVKKDLVPGAKGPFQGENYYQAHVTSGAQEKLMPYTTAQALL